MEKILFLKDEEKISKERKFSILRQHLVRWNVNPILKFVPCGRMEKEKKKRKKEGGEKRQNGQPTRLDCETGFAVSNTLIY